MKKKAYILGIMVVALSLGLVLSMGYKAAATDAPHNLENTLAQSPNGCTQTCHVLHTAAGNQLTTVLGNANLCIHCHKDTSPANTYFFPVNNPTAPGTEGIHHQYNVPYTNLGGSSPALMFPNKNVLEGNNIICSSCHDVHVVGTGKYGSQKISIQPGVAINNGGATGSLTLDNTVSASATAKSYKINIVQASPATFRISNDGGISWYGWNGSAWAAGVATGRSVGANVPLNDGNNVTVSFAGTFAVNDQWNFYISYSFLRGPLDSGPNTGGVNFCRGCHANRADTAQNVEGANPSKPANGTNKFSHPVGAALSKSYDRATPLDATGVAQNIGDGNSANNLRLAADNTVQCYTCHNVHYGYSNSLVNSDIPNNW